MKFQQLGSIFAAHSHAYDQLTAANRNFLKLFPFLYTLIFCRFPKNGDFSD